jgi:hypothetical protein
MYRRSLIAAFVALGISSTLFAQDRPKEQLVDQVQDSIERAKRFLRQQQRPGGHWEAGNLGGIIGTQGGPTCLALLALLTAGENPKSDVIQSGLNYLRRLEPSGTYVVGLQTMVFAETREARDLPLIQRNVNWLINAMVNRGNNLLIGWGYGSQGPGADNSNSQYALLGLHAGKQAGAKIPPQVWPIVREFYIASQNREGAWGYTFEDRSPRLTMTTAGLCGLFISGMESKENQQGLNKDTGVAQFCGKYIESDAIAKAMAWMARGQNFTFNPSDYKYYNMYGIERTGRMSGQRFLAGRDWYREGCLDLVKTQGEDGSWSGRGLDGWSTVSTAFGLLFLSKGRTPILVSKVAWGRDQEWNRKHHDVKYVVEYASMELFKGMPLAWQVHDARKMDGANRQSVLAEVGDLLQSPILYITGHEKPNLTPLQKEMLKQYVEEGGFVLAEACCGSAAFADGFRALMQELFDKEMTPVPADHAIYRAHAVINQIDKFPLERLDLSCKTVVILSSKPLAGWWEENLNQTGMGQQAFRLAGNIIAYATNMEPPKPRLTRVDVIDQQALNVQLPRGYLKVAQVRHEGDWQPAPAAMKNLMIHLRQESKLDVALQTETVSITQPALFAYKFLYMHGRKRFQYADADLKNLRANLMTGGLLLADACCGSKEFDAAFREFADKLLPGAKLESIPLNDELYSREINGIDIKQVKCRLPQDGAGSPKLQTVAPALEGIRWKGRWVVVYSKYDLGCALEKRPSSDCVGHDYESALKLGSAALLYYLKK